jgi:glutamyl-tRNA synthetase
MGWLRKLNGKQRRIRKHDVFPAQKCEILRIVYVLLESTVLSQNGTMRELTVYRGRLAPSPTGYLHLGHARTFWIAYERAKSAGGTLILRNEDLDSSRAKKEFVSAFIEDLHWLGISWEEGPDIGGPLGPYDQSERMRFYHAAFEQLRSSGFLFPCTCSRQDVLRSAQAPHQDQDEPLYPGTCRTKTERDCTGQQINWRFKVPSGEKIQFQDGYFGRQEFEAGKDFGDFVVWRHDRTPSYQLAVVVDDASMEITEVVRGADLLLSTARQILLYRALGLHPPAFFHCPLLLDEHGKRLAKRHDSLSVREMRKRGRSPESTRLGWAS